MTCDYSLLCETIRVVYAKTGPGGDPNKPGWAHRVTIFMRIWQFRMSSDFADPLVVPSLQWVVPVRAAIPGCLEGNRL
jgi:hypothetical protein